MPAARASIIAGKAIAVATYAFALPVALAAIAPGALGAIVDRPLEPALVASLFLGAACTASLLAARAYRTRDLHVCVPSELTRRGFAAASTNAIAEAAGVAKGLVFHHFSSKSELCLAVLDRVTERVVAGFPRACSVR